MNDIKIIIFFNNNKYIFVYGRKTSESRKIISLRATKTLIYSIITLGAFWITFYTLILIKNNFEKNSVKRNF